MKMNPEVKEKWIEALRSGRYTQADGRLRTRLGYCCLGVLCDLYNHNGWVDGGEDKTDTLSRFKFQDADGNLSSSYLPAEVQDWSGVSMRGDLPTSESDELRTTLATMNDNGRSFEEIAQVIEELL